MLDTKGYSKGAMIVKWLEPNLAGAKLRNRASKLLKILDTGCLCGMIRESKESGKERSLRWTKR